MSERIRLYLEHSSPKPFAYDHEKGLFFAGASTYSPAELPQYPRDMSVSLDEEDESYLDSALVLTLLQPVMLPLLYDWLDRNLDAELCDETAAVMREVYETVTEKKLPDYVMDPGGFMGFNMQRLRAEHPHFSLTTLGNCACLGVTLYGAFDDSVWDEKMAGFDFHNIDSPPQNASLLAGLGHLAHRASQA